MLLRLSFIRISTFLVFLFSSQLIAQQTSKPVWANEVRANEREYIENNGGEHHVFMRKNDVGVIAQEVNKVMPEIVTTRDDGYLAIKYDRLAPLLIEAIKTLTNKVSNLENEIKELKNKE